MSTHPDVLLVEKEAECNANVAYAARQVGVRSYVWNSLGLRGDPASSVAVLDTDVDGAHGDFASGYGAGDFSKSWVFRTPEEFLSYRIVTNSTKSIADNALNIVNKMIALKK